MIRTEESSIEINDTFVEVDYNDGGFQFVVINAIQQAVQNDYECEIYGNDIFMSISFDDKSQSQTFIKKLKKQIRMSD